MYSNHSFARVQVSDRLRDAQQLRQGRQLTSVLRTGRKAEQLAQQARLALARTL